MKKLINKDRIKAWLLVYGLIVLSYVAFIWPRRIKLWLEYWLLVNVIRLFIVFIWMTGPLSWDDLKEFYKDAIGSIDKPI